MIQRMTMTALATLALLVGTVGCDSEPDVTGSEFGQKDGTAARTSNETGARGSGDTSARGSDDTGATGGDDTGATGGGDGRAVTPGCDPSRPTPPTGDIDRDRGDITTCETLTVADRVVCRICYDANRNVVVKACSDDPAPPTPDDPANGREPVACEVMKYDDGLVCKICYDANRNPVSRDCASTTDPATKPGDPGTRSGGGGPDNGPVTCDSFTTETGAICKVCYDANRNVVAKDCTPRGGPPPSDPARPGTGGTVTCDAVKTDDGAICRICYDANRNVVVKDCPR